MTIHPPFTLLRRRRIMGLPVALVVMVAISATAAAYFVASGSGTGSGSTGTLQTVTVSAIAGGDAPGSSLLPGGSAADVILRVTNPNAFAVTLKTVTGNGSIVADGSHHGCTTTGVTFTNQNGLTVALPSGSSLVHLAGAASMDTTSLSNCQGAKFSIPVSITVQAP